MHVAAANITHGKPTAINCIVSMHLIALATSTDRQRATDEIIELTSAFMGNQMEPGEVLALVDQTRKLLTEHGDRLAADLIGKSADASLHDKCYILNAAAAFATRRGALGREAQETIAKIALWLVMSDDDFFIWRSQFEALARAQRKAGRVIEIVDLYG